jgi:hypothetical protein
MNNIADLEKEIEEKKIRIKKLEEALRSLIGWTDGGACSDCDMFREAPSCITFKHHKDCGHLEDINKALELLGLPKDEYHEYENANEEMQRLANERWLRVKNSNKSKE